MSKEAQKNTDKGFHGDKESSTPALPSVESEKPADPPLRQTARKFYFQGNRPPAISHLHTHTTIRLPKTRARTLGTVSVLLPV